MLVATVRALMLRELRALRRQVESYDDEKALWALPAGLPNSTGTLVLHLAGNIQHFLGAKMANTGYVRQRDLEFSRRDVPRTELLREIAASEAAVELALGTLDDASLGHAYPEPMPGAVVQTGEFLVHLAIHLGYHLGQVDYHRRTVTGDTRSLDAVLLKELPSIVSAPV